MATANISAVWLRSDKGPSFRNFKVDIFTVSSINHVIDMAKKYLNITSMNCNIEVTLEYESMTYNITDYNNELGPGLYKIKFTTKDGKQSNISKDDHQNKLYNSNVLDNRISSVSTPESTYNSPTESIIQTNVNNFEQEDKKYGINYWTDYFDVSAQSNSESMVEDYEQNDHQQLLSLPLSRYPNRKFSRLLQFYNQNALKIEDYVKQMQPEERNEEIDLIYDLILNEASYKSACFILYKKSNFDTETTTYAEKVFRHIITAINNGCDTKFKIERSFHIINDIFKVYHEDTIEEVVKSYIRTTCKRKYNNNNRNFIAEDEIRTEIDNVSKSIENEDDEDEIFTKYEESRYYRLEWLHRFKGAFNDYIQKFKFLLTNIEWLHNDVVRIFQQKGIKPDISDGLRKNLPGIFIIGKRENCIREIKYNSVPDIDDQLKCIDLLFQLIRLKCQRQDECLFETLVLDRRKYNSIKDALEKTDLNTNFPILCVVKESSILTIYMLLNGLTIKCNGDLFDAIQSIFDIAKLFKIPYEKSNIVFFKMVELMVGIHQTRMPDNARRLLELIISNHKP